VAALLDDARDAGGEGGLGEVHVGGLWKPVGGVGGGPHGRS